VSVHPDILLLHIASDIGYWLDYAWNVRRFNEIMSINSLHLKQPKQSHFNSYEN
jgi:hypothetical protein